MTGGATGARVYRRAGVDRSAAASAVDLIRDLASSATRPEVVEGVGGFAGLYRLDDSRLLAAGADNVGTKLEVARAARRLDTVGIDLVAMCADDVACTGAEPLFFLDYLAAGRLVPEQVAEIVGGVAEGCRRAGCALLGGETAELPGMLLPGQFDLSGFCVGLVEEDRLLGPHRVEAGHVLVGLASSGLHSNGYSLVRSVLVESGRFALGEEPPGLGRSLAEELLEPTAIYAPLLLRLADRGLVRAAAHITGGGLVENVPRALPPGLGARIDPHSWTPSPIFDLVAREADVQTIDLADVLNLGIGMVLVAGPEDLDQVMASARSHGMDAMVIGQVVEGPGVRFGDDRAP